MVFWTETYYAQVHIHTRTHAHTHTHARTHTHTHFTRGPFLNSCFMLVPYMQHQSSIVLWKRTVNSISIIYTMALRCTWILDTWDLRAPCLKANASNIHIDWSAMPWYGWYLLHSQGCLLPLEGFSIKFRFTVCCKGQERPTELKECLLHKRV